MPESGFRWDSVRSEVGLRWGGLLGAAGAALEVFAYFVGPLLTPVSSKPTDGNVAITVVLIRGLFLLVALGIVLGLAYYAGWRVARERAGSVDRAPSAVAGGLVMLIYLVASRILGALVVFPPAESLSGQELGGQLLVGVGLVAIGVGLGGFGARTAATSKISETIIVTKPTPPTPPVE